jgi:hypothetical protein
VFGLDRVGKEMEMKPFEFEIDSGSNYEQKNTEKARVEVDRVCPEGWSPDHYFNSKDSFFIKDDKVFARTMLRRWVDIDNG